MKTLWQQESFAALPHLLEWALNEEELHDKKDHPRRPYIVYQCLNDMIIKGLYPLPLIDSEFELLKGTITFTKLELHSTYKLV